MSATHGKCLLCGSPRLSHSRTFSKAFLVTCLDCQFVFSDRKPTEAELSEHYLQYPRDSSLSPITRARYIELCRAFERYRKFNNILDVGCGDGHFLAVAKDLGWNVYGTEFTDEAVRVGERKGITMKKGRLKEAQFDSGSFDVITSIEVMEHLDDPMAEATAIYSLLRSGGCCYVTTPNFNSLSRYFFGSRWNVVEYPEHLCYFKNTTLKRLFSMVGMEVESIATTGFSLARLRAALGGKFDGTAAGLDERFRQNAESSGLLRFIKSAMNNLLQRLAMGDTLKAAFRKP